MKHYKHYIIAGIVSIVSLLGVAYPALAQVFPTLQFTLTTTGTSGAATFTNNVLNVPQYSGGGSGSTLITAGTGISTSTSSGGAILVSNTGVLSLMQTYGSAQTGILTLATSSTSFNGLTVADAITNSGGTFTVTPLWSGLLNVSGGGTGQSSFTSGNLLYGSGNGALQNVATTSVSCSGTVSCTSFNVLGASPITITGIGGGSTYPFALASNATSTLTNFLGGIGATTIQATSTATSTITNLGGILAALGFPGADMGIQIMKAAASLYPTGGVITVPCGTYRTATQLSFQTNNEPIALEGCGSGATTIIYTGQATSTIFNDGQSPSANNGPQNITIEGTSTTDIAPGVQFGGSNGFAYSTVQNLSVTDFGNNIALDNNVYIDNFSHIVSNFGTSTLQFEWSTNSGENISFTNSSVFSDGKNSAGVASYTNCVNLVPNPNQGSASVNFTDTSFDKCQVHVGTENNIFFDSPHFEILGNTGSAYTPLVIDADTNSTVSIVNPHFIDGNSSSFSPAQWITNAGNLYITNAAVSEYGGYTIPTFVNNTGNGARSYTNINNVAGTGYTTLETNTGQANNTYSLNSGVLTLGTTTSAAATTPLQVFGPTWQGGDLYQGLICDTNSFCLSTGYDNTHNWVALHPVELGVTSLDLFIGSPFGLTTGTIFKATGLDGIGTTSPFARLSVAGGAGGSTPLFAVSSSTAGFATTTVVEIDQNGNVILNKNSLTLTALGAGELYTNSAGLVGTSATTTVSCSGTVSCTAFSTFGSSPVTITGSGGSSFAYPFPLTGNATSTLTQFNGGITAYATSTIGSGSQTTGLTINGGATTTLNAYFASNVGIGSTSPSIPLSVIGGAFIQGMATTTNGLWIGYGNSNNTQLFLSDPGNWLRRFASDGSTEINGPGGIRLDVSGATDAMLASNGSFGIGTTTPVPVFTSEAASTTAGTVQTPYVGVVAMITGLENTTLEIFFEIDQWGHQITSGNAPSVTGGTSSVSGNDDNGKITVVGTALTSVTLTFAHPWPVAPDCVESDNQTASVGDIGSISPTQIVFNFSVGVSSASVWYQCVAHQ